MKLIYCVIAASLIVLVQNATAHQQRVHQHIVTEAYELLRTEAGNIPQMHDHVGGIDPYYQGERAWQRPFLTTGAWREDEEDPMFGYRLSNLLNNYSLVSISHFWDADQGDLNTNLFRVNPLPGIVFNIGPYENSYDKLLRYANGGWILWFPDTITVQRLSNGHFLTLMPFEMPPPVLSGIPMQYTSLTTFYQSYTLTLRSDVTGAYVIFDINDQTVIPPGTSAFDVRVLADVRDRVAWEVLGRMCHLLGDVSVPTHTRRDEHGLNPDSYENWVGTPGGPYLYWTHDSVGQSINPYNADNDPLHYLMYTMQQQANHFGSNGPYEGNGNDIIGGSPRPLENLFLIGVGLPSLGPPTGNGPWDEPNLRNIMNKTLPYAIRATAGLLYWFARETNLVPPVKVQTNREVVPTGFRLEQNFPNPFNPSTEIRYQTSEVSHITLRVYDLLGREVATLVDEVQEPGYKTAQWNASGLASGVYLYRLTTGSFISTRKMVVVR